MGTLQGIIILVFSINAMLMIADIEGSNFAKEALSDFITVNEQQVLLNQTAATNVPKTVSTNTVESTATGFNFVDVLRTPFDILTTMMSFLLAPINIANSLGLPLAVTLLLMGPITVAFYAALYVAIRGGGGG